MKTKYVWRYWLAGMKKPGKLPEGCEWQCQNGEWLKEKIDPTYWARSPRRWRVKVPTCKWDGILKDGEKEYRCNPHTGEWNFQTSPRKFCCVCSRPIEDVTRRKFEQAAKQTSREPQAFSNVCGKPV